jgi:hypothetical protein
MASKKVCLCNICTCGRHKCPHNPQGIPRGNEPCIYSEYTREYKPHDHYGRQPDCKPERGPATNTGPMDGLTTHRVDYVEHPLGQHYVHKADPYRQPDGDMNHITNYQQQFTPKEQERVKPIRRAEESRVSAKFAGEPTYKADYRPWDVPPRTKYGSDYVYRPTDGPFDALTNYTTEYIAHGNVPRQGMLRPDQGATQSDQPFEDSTDYKSSYVKHELPKRETREKEVWQTNPARLDDISNYRRDYIARELSKTASCKPDNKPYESDTKFEGLTTHREDYRTLQLDRPYVHEREPYRKPEGGMDSMTTHKFDYTTKTIDRAAPIRPAESKKVSASFDSTTQYSTDYRGGQGERAQPMQRERYNPTEARFEGEPTYKRDYVSYGGVPLTRSLKPLDPGIASNVPLDQDTEYKQEYKFKLLPPCPSDAIMAGRTDTGFTFKEQDELGHRWYEVATRA